MNKKKKIIISSCCIIFLGIVALAIYKATKIPPNFEKLSDEKVLEYLKSEKAENLSREKLIKLGERLEKINPETRREAMGNLRGEVNLVRANCLTKILYEIYLVVRNFKVTPHLINFLSPRGEDGGEGV